MWLLDEIKKIEKKKNENSTKIIFNPFFFLNCKAQNIPWGMEQQMGQIGNE